MSTIIIIGGINSTSFNVAVPAIQSEFGLEPSQVSWVISAYVIVFAIGSITYGKLADIFPIRNLITVGLLLFSLGSVIGFFSGNYWILMAGRVIQATGGAALPALEMLAAIRYFPAEKRGRVLGIIAFAISFGWGIGPIAGGLIAGILDWRFIFLTSLFTVAAIPFLRRWLPEEKTNRTVKLDVRGALLTVATVGVLMLLVSKLMMWLLPVFLILLSVSLIYLWKTDEPFINLALFRRRKYRNGLVTLFLAIITVFGMLFVVPLMLEEIYGLGAMEIGFIMFPGSLVGAIFGIIAGRWADQLGSLLIVYLAIFALFAGYVFLAMFPEAGLWVLALVLIFPYLGFVFMQSALPNTILNTLSAAESGVGVGVYNFVFFTAGAFGPAIAGTMLEFPLFRERRNPLFMGEEVFPHSNVFFVFVLMMMVVFALFYRAYREPGKNMRSKRRRVRRG